MSLHVQVLGSGPPVVMLHGLLVGSLASWYFTAAPALARSHRVVLYDLRGHGRSERAPTGYDLTTQAADLRAVLDATGVAEPAVLVGHSYGALVALRLALDTPERVRSLALVEPPLPPSRFEELHGFLRRTPAEMIEALPGPLRELLTGGRGGRRARRLLDGLSFLASETTLLDDLQREADVPDDDLAALTMPVLALFGDRSSCRPIGQRLRRVVRHARVEELPGGHYLHLDAAPAIRDHLLELARA